MNRRLFIKNTSAWAFTSLALPAWAKEKDLKEENTLFSNVNLLSHTFNEPIIIQKVEVIRFEKEFLIKTTAKSGEFGLFPTNSRMPYLWSLWKGLVAPFFIGKDARNIENLVEECYRDERNYKFSGMPLWNCIGTLELSILDLLGKIAQKPVFELFGKKIRDKVPVYLTTFDRKQSPQETLERIEKKLKDTSIKAVKFKVGGRMKDDIVGNRTEELVPLLRKKLGDNIELYADANGSFDVKRGIEVGKLLESYGIKIYEEPCPWEDFEGNIAVAKNLKKLSVAIGEQETSMPKMEWIAKNKFFKLLQPDMMYFGGFTRVLRLARFAEKYGVAISPHSPRAGVLEAPKLHLSAILSNLGGFQEYKPENFLEKYTSPNCSEVKNGFLIVPQGAGWGVSYDENWLQSLSAFEP
jgi:L-alanine-DL-glutamate epimerase-like enolase superfamily enzyme